MSVHGCKETVGSAHFKRLDQSILHSGKNEWTSKKVENFFWNKINSPNFHAAVIVQAKFVWLERKKAAQLDGRLVDFFRVR